MYIFYHGIPESEINVTGNTVLSIDACVFSDGVAVSDEVRRLSGGLTISYEKSLAQYDVEISVLISNVVSTRNVGMDGTNFLFENIGNVNIKNTTSSMANYLISLLDEELDRERVGFVFTNDVLDPSIQIHTTNKTLLHISDSRFHDNNGGGLYFQLQVYSNISYHVIIKNCSFQRNVNLFGSGVLIEYQFFDHVLSSTSGLEVLVQNTSFTNHAMPEQNSNIIQTFTHSNVITVYNLRHLNIINCTFAMNNQTALQAYDSTLYFGGNVIFSGNTGTLGGALMLQGGSTFYLMPHTHVQIINNHAKRGGGIYVEDEYTRINGPCFFQLVDLHSPYSDFNSVVTLENNTAGEAGSAVHGGEIDNCYLYTSGLKVIHTG